MKALGENSLSDWLGVFVTIFWLGAWFVVAAFVVIPFLGLENTSFTFETPIAHGLRVEMQGPGGTWKLRTVVADVSTPHSRAWIGSLLALPFIVLIALVLGGLRKILLSLREGSPFVSENARRLRRIGLLMLLIETLRVIVTATLVCPLIEELEPVTPGRQVIEATAWPNWEFVFTGCAVLILAEVFRRGTAMRDEQALTV